MSFLANFPTGLAPESQTTNCLVAVSFFISGKTKHYGLMQGFLRVF